MTAREVMQEYERSAAALMREMHRHEYAHGCATGSEPPTCEHDALLLNTWLSAHHMVLALRWLVDGVEPRQLRTLWADFAEAA